MTTAIASNVATNALALDARAARRRAAQVEIVVPVHNEEAGLDASIRRLHRELDEHFPLPWLITIADNASVDGTWAIACRLAQQLDGVQVLHLNQKGRGRALRHAWLASDAPVVAYMDVDLSTGLDALLPLVAPLLTGHSDLAIGTRLARVSRVVRGPRREVISRSYNLILRTILHLGASDAQCGFKAMRTAVARELLPEVVDDAWFFDTELLVLAERQGLRVHEVPVDWVDDPDSRVHVVQTALDDLRGVVRLLRSSSGRTPHGDVPLHQRAGSLAGLAVGGLPLLAVLTLVTALALLGAAPLALVLGATAAYAVGAAARVLLLRRPLGPPRPHAGTTPLVPATDARPPTRSAPDAHAA